MTRQKTKTTFCPRCRENGRDTKGNNLVWFDEDNAHCFACGYHVWPKHYTPVKPKKDYHGSTVLPADFTKEVPAKAWKWLLQYGLPIKYWRPYVGYSESHSRLVLTCGDPVLFSIGRDLTGESKAKWLAYGDTHKTAVSYGDVSSAKQVVLVEDLVSAHKVAQCSLVIPLFGTVVHPCHYKLLKYFGLPVVIWLDKDQEQYIPKKVAQLSIMTGLPCSNITTDKDPKELTQEYIKEKLLDI
jgi:hypothetical protein